MRNAIKLCALFILSLSVTACSCFVTPRTEPTPAPRPAAVPPVGLNVDPSDPSRGWITQGGNIIHFRLIEGRWMPQDAPGSTQNVVDSRPSQYEPMMRFLRENNLRVHDIDTVARAYNLMGVRADQGEAMHSYLHNLNQTLKTTPVPLDKAVEYADILRQVNGRVD